MSAIRCANCHRQMRELLGRPVEYRRYTYVTTWWCVRCKQEWRVTVIMCEQEASQQGDGQ